jgi:hypothetical protein
LPDGFEAGLIPRRFFTISIFPLDVAWQAESSSRRQDLAAAADFFR